MSDLTQWSTPRKLADRATSARPALALHNNTLCMAWRGIDGSPLFVSTSQDGGATWSAQRGLVDHRATGGPALAAFNNQLVMVYREDDGKRMRTTTSRDGVTWSPAVRLDIGATDESPALAAVGSGASALAVLCWTGVDTNNLFVSTSRDFVTWTPQRQLVDRETQSGPSVTGTVNGPTFVMTWRGRNSEQVFVSRSQDGLTWSPQKKLSFETGAPPAITHSDNLGVYYLAWQGKDTKDIFVSSSRDGLDWSGEHRLRDRDTRSGPALSPVARTLYMVWRGLDTDNLWTSTLQT
jgi:hypothetical protein